MRKILSFIILGFTFLIFILSHLAYSQENLTADEIIRRSQAAFYYPGSDMLARVLMKLITKDGKERIRDLTMLRKNLDKGGEQRYFIYFHTPPDVKDMTFMVWKYPGKDDDRWLFIPAIKLVKRIAANDKRSSFVGSDFSYEDVSGRDAEEDNHSILKEEVFNGKDTYVIKSVPEDEVFSERYLRNPPQKWIR